MEGDSSLRAFNLVGGEKFQLVRPDVLGPHEAAVEDGQVDPGIELVKPIAVIQGEARAWRL
jgi:hypothetical protein